MSCKCKYILTKKVAIGSCSENDFSERKHSLKVPLKEFSFQQSFKVACVVEITSFDTPKKAKCLFFIFFIFRLLSSRFQIQGLPLMYQKVSSKNDLRFLVKLSTENSSFMVNVFYFDKLQLAIKISKRNQLKLHMFTNQLFHKRVFGFFLIQIIACEILICVLHHIFRF